MELGHFVEHREHPSDRAVTAATHNGQVFLVMVFNKSKIKLLPIFMQYRDVKELCEQLMKITKGQRDLNDALCAEKFPASIMADEPFMRAYGLLHEVVDTPGDEQT